MPPAALKPLEWPYPRWIAHRGAGTLAPENTVAAFRLGARYGYRMFECDVRLSADDVPFLLHDDALERTTNGHGPAGAQPWSALRRLDAGRWHSPAFAGEPPPSLAEIADFCLTRSLLLNIEIKPGPGLAQATGAAVAREAARLWAVQAATHPPLLTSFQPLALIAAREAAPTLPRGLLLEYLFDGWLSTAQDLGCVAVIAHRSAWSEAALAKAQAAGLRCLAFTVNDAVEVARLQGWGIDGIITDAVDRFSPVD